MALFTNCRDKCCVCYCYGNGCLAGHGDDDFHPATQEQLITRIDNCGLDDSNRNYMKNHQDCIEDEEETIKLTGEVILDDESLNKLKEELRKEVIESIKLDGLSDDEAKKFLLGIDNVSGFVNILIEVLPEFLNSLDNGKFHFDDEAKYKKLKMCYDILIM